MWLSVSSKRNTGNGAKGALYIVLFSDARKGALEQPATSGLGLAVGVRAEKLPTAGVASGVGTATEKSSAIGISTNVGGRAEKAPAVRSVDATDPSSRTRGAAKETSTTRSRRVVGIAHIAQLFASEYTKIGTKYIKI